MITIIRLAALVACVGIVVSAAPPAIRAIGAIPLIFVLPGYALSLNAVPRSADLATRAAWTLGLSITVSVLLPILVGSAGILVSPQMWLVGLVTVTLVGEVAARLRPSVPQLQLSRPRARVPMRSAAFLAIAATIALGGIAASYVDADRRAVTTATQLWMVPGTGGDVRIGVMPYGSGDEPLRLVIDDGSTRREFPIAATGATFETTWPLAADVTVVQASLYVGDSSSPIREVFHRVDP